jgi:hypothetical protein
MSVGIRGQWLTFAVLAATLVPVATVPIPLLLDFPNHLARLWILSSDSNSASVSKYYQVDWESISTNIGIDIAAKASSAFLPIFFTVRLLVAAAVVMPPAGAMLLHRQIHRGKSGWVLVFGSFAFPLTLLLGFLNFQIGMGLALFSAWLEPRLAKRFGPFAPIARIFVGCALLIVHPFALLFYAFLLAGLKFGRDQIDTNDVNATLRRARSAMMTAAVCLIPIVLFLLRSKGLPGTPHLGDTNRTGTWVFNSLSALPKTIASPFYGYQRAMDLGLAACVAALGVVAAVRNGLKMHTGLAIAGSVLVTLVPFMPSTSPQSADLHLRLPILALWAILCAVAPGPIKSMQDRRVIIGFAIFLVAAKTGSVGYNWIEGQKLVRSVQSSLSILPTGARLLAAQVSTGRVDATRTLPGRYVFGDTATYSHLASLAVPMKSAFVPTLFAEHGKQPISIRQYYVPIAVPNGGYLNSIEDLKRFSDLPNYGFNINSWRSNFDYLIILNSDASLGENDINSLSGIKLLSDNGFSRLYKIVHEPKQP